MFQKYRLLLIIKIAIIFLCVSGLIWQTSQLVSQYWDRQTVVNVELETIKYNRIPALTICYPRLLSMHNMLTKFPQLNVLYNQIQDNLNKSQNGRKSIDLTEFYDDLTYFIENSTLSVIDFFELSIPFEFRNSNPIQVKVKGIQLQPNTSLNRLGELSEIEMQPIESVVFPNGRQGHKCFTFFHHLNKDIRKYQIDVKEISIKVFHDEKWFPLQLYATDEVPESSMIWFSMHSPTNFPQHLNANNFLRLKAGKMYEMTYNRMKTDLLPPPYKTNCKYYSLDESHDKMRSDCVNQCIQQMLNKKCSDFSENYVKCFFRSEGLWRRDYFHNQMLKFCPKFSEPLKDLSAEDVVKLLENTQCIESNIGYMQNECENQCQPVCTNRFYNYQVIFNIKHNFTKWYRENGNMIASITLAHNQLPDQNTKHIPEMTFIQFFANFGGLFGIWLGLSALAILQFLLKPVIKFLRKSVLNISDSMEINTI